MSGRAAGTVRPLGLAVFAVLPLAAWAAEVERIDIVDKGIYEIVTGEVTVDPDAPTGEVTAVASEMLVEATGTIAGRLGLEFGYRYVIVGEPEGETVQLDFVFTYPPPGLSDPAESGPITETRFTREKIVGDTIYLGYGFENDWELVAGTWTFAIWHEGTKLAEEAFEVKVE